MSVIKFNRNFSELFNWDSDESPTTEQEYQNAVKNWTETEMNIVDTILWQPETDYVENNIVKTPSLPLHYVLVCTTGGTSGTEEPSYDNVQIGDSVTDGTVTWTVAKLTVSSDVPIVTDRAMVDASNIGVNAEEDNSEAWGSAIGGGAVAEDDGRLVTGGTVHAVTSVLASDIADNTDDIADNTANISQNATDIGIADKRISNIEKLLQGNLYDYQTDNSSAYTKSVPSGAMPYAGLEKIGGKTLVWNQIFPSLNLTNLACNTTVGTLTENADDSVTYTLTTASHYAYIKTNVADMPLIISGHTYYCRIDIKTPGTQVSMRINNSNTVFKTWSGLTADTRTVLETIGAITTGETSPAKYIYPTWTTGATGECILYSVTLVDLTLCYGSGNEPTTVAEFQQMFPAQYYPYNAGTLLSAGVTEVVSKKADTTTLATYPVPAEVQALEGYGWSAGTAYNYIDYERKVFVKCVDKIVLDGTQTIQLTNWRPQTNTVGWGYPASMVNVKKPQTNSDQPNIVADSVMATYYTNLYQNDIRGIGVVQASDNTYSFFVRGDSTLTNSTAINTYLSANPLTVYYELATPIETDISQYLTDDNLIEVEAGGSLTFPNSNGDNYRIPVPSAETYMVDLQSALGE